jgi:hypothetical protein
MTVHPTAGLVRSASDGASAHHVTLPSCDCADFINRKGQLVEVDGGFVEATAGMVAVTVCKHIAEFLERVGGWHRETRPEVHAGIPLNVVREYLAGAEVSVDLMAVAVDSAVLGSPSIIPAQGKRGEIRIEVIRERRPRLYTVTLSA